MDQLEYIPRVTPIHRSLNEPRLIAGVERELMILNATITAAVVMGFGLFIWVGIAVFAHIVLVWMTKKDPMMRKIYIRYRRQSFCYDPWPQAVQQENLRPYGYDRGNLC